MADALSTNRSAILLDLILGGRNGCGHCGVIDTRGTYRREGVEPVVGMGFRQRTAHGLLREARDVQSAAFASAARSFGGTRAIRMAYTLQEGASMDVLRRPREHVVHVLPDQTIRNFGSPLSLIPKASSICCKPYAARHK